MNFIADLVTLWRSCRLPGPLEASACRARLFEAATREIAAKGDNGISYDPLHDIRFKWAAQWIEVAEGERKTVDPEVDMLCRFAMEPAPLTRKHAAAGDLDSVGKEKGMA
jgi:hypothetical protein